jgi:hypothetical protein
MAVLSISYDLYKEPGRAYEDLILCVSKIIDVKSAISDQLT